VAIFFFSTGVFHRRGWNAHKPPLPAFERGPAPAEEDEEERQDRTKPKKEERKLEETPEAPQKQKPGKTGKKKKNLKSATKPNGITVNNAFGMALYKAMAPVSGFSPDGTSYHKNLCGPQFVQSCTHPPTGVDPVV